MFECFVAFSIMVVILMGTVQAGYPPRIEQHPSHTVVNTSEPVTLECRASGEPRPTISWYKDAALISYNSRFSLIHDSNLFIMSASVGKGNRSDSGVYFCKASNEFGEANSANASLIVTCKSRL